MRRFGAVLGGTIVLAAAQLAVVLLLFTAHIGIPPLVSTVAAVVVVVYPAVLAVAAFFSMRRNVVLNELARDNGFDFVVDDRMPMYSGLPFAAPGAEARAVRVLSSNDGAMAFRVGGYRVVKRENSKAVEMRSFGFVELALAAEVPNLVLRNKRSTVFLSAGVGLPRAQRLSLEGDFQKSFSLYVPEGYERDALYIFTPDLMLMLQRVAADFEVEFVGRSVFLYSARAPRVWREGVLTDLVAALEALSAKLDRQTGSYRDDRVIGTPLAGRVGLGGRFLRTSNRAGLTATFVTVASLVGVGIVVWQTIMSGGS